MCCGVVLQSHSQPPGIQAIEPRRESSQMDDHVGRSGLGSSGGDRGPLRAQVNLHECLAEPAGSNETWMTADMYLAHQPTRCAWRSCSTGASSRAPRWARKPASLGTCLWPAECMLLFLLPSCQSPGS